MHVSQPILRGLNYSSPSSPSSPTSPKLDKNNAEFNKTGEDGELGGLGEGLIKKGEDLSEKEDFEDSVDL